MDYRKLKEICDTHSREGEEVHDRIMYYGAEKDKLAILFDRQVKPLKHVLGKLGTQTVERLKAQFITYKIFKKEGLIHKYLNHSTIKNLAPADYEFLQKASRQPYRFAYLQPLDSPAPEFFNMRDVFTGEKMLFYSPGIAKDYGSAMMFFAMISDNGSCYQTYGPIGAFRGFDPDDIYFYATEWDQDISTEEELMAFVHRDPIKFIALLSYTNIPLTVHKEHALVEVVTFADADRLDDKKLKEQFKVKRAGGILKFSLKNFDGFPHFAILYLDTDVREMVLTAMTDTGYTALHKAIAKLGVDLPEYPDLRVHSSMRLAMNEIFKKDIALHPYESAFVNDDPQENEHLEQVNLLLGALVTSVNAGENPDLARLAQKFGQDEESVKGMYEMLLEKVGKGPG